MCWFYLLLETVDNKQFVEKVPVGSHNFHKQFRAYGKLHFLCSIHYFLS